MAKGRRLAAHRSGRARTTKPEVLVIRFAKAKSTNSTLVHNRCAPTDFLLVNQSTLANPAKIRQRSIPRSNNFFGRFSPLEALKRVGVRKEPQVAIDFPIGA